MEKIEAIIKPFDLEETRHALLQAGVENFIVTEVMEFGCRTSHSEIYRGSEYSLDYSPRVKIEIAVSGQCAAPAIAAIRRCTSAPRQGAGKIFRTPLQHAVAIGANDALEAIY